MTIDTFAYYSACLAFLNFCSVLAMFVAIPLSCIAVLTVGSHNKAHKITAAIAAILAILCLATSCGCYTATGYINGEIIYAGLTGQNK